MWSSIFHSIFHGPLRDDPDTQRALSWVPAEILSAAILRLNS